jgi:hypothetical protein
MDEEVVDASMVFRPFVKSLAFHPYSRFVIRRLIRG